ncbi:MAG: VOC family protein [Bacteroidetes bacterium]|nr:VOC family protein [Bacteroidota bacterium]
MAKINPYLNFSGNTEEAFNFYKSVFGGEFQTIMRYKDMPQQAPPGAQASERIMHVALPINNDSLLMGCDRPEAYGEGTRGDNFHISIQTESEEETRRIFNALSEGGKVTMPLERAFWGAYFGMLTDKFGIQWMVSYDTNQLSAN